MKKFLLSLATLALAATTAMADEVTFDFATNDYGLTRQSENNAPYIASGTQVTSGDISITLNKAKGNGWRLWSDGLRVYKNSDASMVISANGGNITNVEATFKSGVITAYSLNGGAPVSVSGGKFSATTASENVNLALTVPSNGAVYTVKVTYEPAAGDKEHAGLQFSETSCTAILGQAFTAPTLTKATNAAVSYTSSNPEVAAVNATTGEVTLVAAGTTTIKAEAPENDTYTAGSAQYTLTVVKGYNTLAEYLAACGNKNDEGYINFPLTVTYVIGGNTYVIDEAGTAGLIFKYDLGYEVGNIIPAGWTAQTDNFNGLIELKPVSTMPASTENSGVTYNEVTSIDESMVNEVVVLKNVTFAAETPDTKTNFSGTTPDGTEYTFRNNFTIASTAAGIYDVKVAVANFKGALQLYPLEYQQAVSDVPVISGTELNDENQFASTSTVTITAAEGATIYYRTNTEADFQVYNAPFTINATTSIYAYAVEEGKQQSREVSVTYYYNPSLGIDGIEVENGAAEYYNMQGVRVANPENGMYIRVQNGKAQKVIIK